jgi:hypothetical protein
MAILLSDIWNIQNRDEYKIHFARYNQHSQPLEVWVRDKREWQGWQEFWPGRNDFNLPFIFSMMQFYHEPETWLFGGVFHVMARHEDRYEVALTDQGKDFIGRLKIRTPYKNRATRTCMEPWFNDFEVKEVLAEPYKGQAFPGFQEIDLSFEELEALAKTGRPDWKAALESVKGVYLVTDCHTGKKYVGAAYGEHGVWSRWMCYIESGHGGNVGIHSLIKEHDIDYCRKNFRFALLEHSLFNEAREKIQARETFWKNVLFTRGARGLNRN